jgi:hypothetical protein
MFKMLDGTGVSSGKCLGIEVQASALFSWTSVFGDSTPALTAGAFFPFHPRSPAAPGHEVIN